MGIYQSDRCSLNLLHKASGGKKEFNLGPGDAFIFETWRIGAHARFDLHNSAHARSTYVHQRDLCADDCVANSDALEFVCH